MSDSEHMEHMEAAEQEWERARETLHLHDIIVCSLNKILRCLVCLVMCIRYASWVKFCSCMSAYKISFDGCNYQEIHPRDIFPTPYSERFMHHSSVISGTGRTFQDSRHESPAQH